MAREPGIDEIQFSTLSVVDGVGKVFFWRDRVFRAIHQDAVDEIRAVLDSGLIEELTANNLFPKTWIANFSLPGFGMVLEHECYSTVVYPYEWSFLMLKDAALLVLKVNLIARKYGYETKDCHGLNVIFDGVAPKFVDLGSFVKTRDGYEGWRAYEEFLQFYYYPLRLWRQGNGYIARRMLLGSNLMPHTSFLLYKNPFYRILPSYWLERIIYFYHRFRRLSGSTPADIKARFSNNVGRLLAALSARGALPFQAVDLDAWVRKITRLEKKANKTLWSGYQDKHHNVRDDLTTPRFERLMHLLAEYPINSVVELAANQGVFSRLLLRRTKVSRAICIDSDEDAVDKLYVNAKGNDAGLTPVLLDFVSPLASHYGTPPHARFQSDAVVAMAITHHMMLGAGVPIERVFKTIARYSRRYVFIEFMPLGLYDGKQAPPLPPWYNRDFFREHFCAHFSLLREEQLEENRVLFFGRKQENSVNDAG